MPELAEIEHYRVLLARAKGREICKVRVTDPRYLSQGLSASSFSGLLRGRSFDRVSRTGKLLVLSIAASDHKLGLHLGMNGHLLLDGEDPVGPVPHRGEDGAVWDRVVISFCDRGDLRVRDPRRFGRVMLDPDLSRLGPDVLILTEPQLRSALAGSREPVKARLLDQTHVAELGNLTVDEALWLAGINPRRPAASLAPTEIHELHNSLLATAHASIERGASRAGAFVVQRHDGGICPQDGTALRSVRIRGRSSWFCPKHQPWAA